LASIFVRDCHKDLEYLSPKFIDTKQRLRFYKQIKKNLIRLCCHSEKKLGQGLAFRNGLRSSIRNLLLYHLLNRKEVELNGEMSEKKLDLV
jgi:hypothetical protein